MRQESFFDRLARLQTIQKVFPDLYAIIVNYNLKHDTVECVESLIRAGLRPERIIIVDNASIDGSVNFFRQVYGSNIKILPLECNGGYPFALNRGIPFALSQGAEWLLLMNNDTVVSEDFLVQLEKTASDSTIGIIAPNILYFSAPDTVWYLGSIVLPGTLIGIRSYRGVKVTNVPNVPFPVDFVHGCSMVVRRDVFQKIGMFDESQLIYGDDPDFSWRAHLANIRMMAAPMAKIWHKISLTMSKQKPKTRYLRIRNQILFYKKYSKGFTRLVMFLFTLIRTTGLVGIEFINGDLDLIRPLILGFADGWLGKHQDRY